MAEFFSAIESFLSSGGGFLMGLGLMFGLGLGIPIMAYWIPHFKADTEKEKTRQLEIKLKIKELEAGVTTNNPKESNFAESESN